ncbi:MAG: glycogen synthase [Desulfobacterales bacterium]
MDVLFVAAENGALPGGKVGGIGDVIRDLPPALAARGCRVTIVTPSHGFLHASADARKIGGCRFRFRGAVRSAEIYERFPTDNSPGVRHLVVDHPLLGALDADADGRRIYTHDPPDRPFFTDASRFACFGAAVAAAISDQTLGPFDVIHLHDWHAAVVALLARFHADAPALREPRWVFSIHNLAFQGVRPLRGSDSSLEAWFPDLRYDWAAVADPRWPDCINLMAAGIRMADRVHTVSPAYAEEIRRPSRKPQFYGGEGLEADLEAAHRDGRLIGILNGCVYPPDRRVERLGYGALLEMIRKETIWWAGDTEAVSAAHFIAFARTLEAAASEIAPEVMLTSVGRAGEQKMLLLRHRGSSGKSGLQAILEGIGPQGLYVLLGTGDAGYERFLAAAGARHENFIFVNGFSEWCAGALYTSGDLFLMPSSFEPCGLSQMLAMRNGQPCVVHAVGGLKDTVRPGYNGFSFEGATVEEQVDRFVTTTLAAVDLKRNDADAWEIIRQNAAAARFTWEGSAERYLRELYR